MASTAEVKAALFSRYSGDAWALFWEVPNGTGMNKCRSADAIAMSLWPSRGLLLHGHEIKVSRADWLKELKQPEKAESICRFCDHWWVVAGDKSIVKDGELPPTWGLIVLNGKGLVIKQQAPALSPQPIDRSFLAGLLRAASKTAAKDDDEVIREARHRGYQEGQAEAARSDGEWRKKAGELSKAIDEFEAASGVRISQYRDNAEIGQKVKAVMLAKDAIARAKHDVWNIYRSAKSIVSAAEQTGMIESREG